MLSRILRLLNLRRNTNPGRDLGELRIRKEKQAKRDRVDQMRREMGLRPVKWPPL